MEFKAARCPHCGGELQVPTDRESVKCMYCGTDIIVQKAIIELTHPSINSLLKIAASAMSAENYREAYKYFIKVLDINPEIEIAWVDRGLSVGFISNIINKKKNEDLLSGVIGQREEEEIDNDIEVKNEEVSFCFKRARELNANGDLVNYAPIRLKDFQDRLYGKSISSRLAEYKNTENDKRQEDDIRNNMKDENKYWIESEVFISVTAGKDKFNIDNTVLSNATSMEGPNDVNFDKVFGEWTDCIKEHAKKYNDYKDGLILYLGGIKKGADKCNLKESSFVKWYSSLLGFEENKDNIVSEIIKLCKKGHDYYLQRRIEPLLFKFRMQRLNEYLKVFIQRLEEGT